MDQKNGERARDMSEESRAKIRCLFLHAGGAGSAEVLRALRAGGKEAGAQLQATEGFESGQFVAPPAQAFHAEAARSDLVLADVSVADPQVFYELGIAQAMGKPTMLMMNESVTPVQPFDPGASMYLTYSPTREGLLRLQQDFARLLKEFRRFPRRFRPFPTIPARMLASAFVDIDRLEPREAENLCFELLTQMGFKRMEWGKEFREFDLVATLPKKDPDGFEYRELWLISMGLNVPIEESLHILAMEPEYFVRHLLQRREGGEDAALLRPEIPVTLLLIHMAGRLPPEIMDRELRRAITRRAERYGVWFRLRVWDKQQLTDLVQQYPQLVYKYFSEEGRERSSIRKGYEQLYAENVTLSEQLQVTNQELRRERDKRVRAERDAVWKDLSFTAAHKLGNPVFALETDLQGLKTRISPKSKQAQEVADEMVVSVEKAKKIIEQFKSLTKAQEIQPAPVDVVPLVRQACRVAEEQGIKVIIEAPPELPQVMADPQRITECFDEMVANAFHWFDKDRKQIKVSLASPKRGLPAGLDQSKEYVRIRFEDNGCGIPAGSKEEVFAPFYTTHPHGTGLGLSLVQRIIEGHGGLIRETGKFAHGARFEVFLPTATEREDEN